MRKLAHARRFAPWLLLLAAACAVPACGTDEEPPPDLGTQLQSDTGVAWGVVVDPRSHAPRVLSPATPVRLGSGTPEADARAFFEHYRTQLGSGGHELRVKTNERELRGGSYIRFQHFVPGTNLRVFDTSSMAHFDADGAAYLLEPGFRAGLDAIPREAKVAEDVAVRTATALLAADCGIAPSSGPSSAPELGVAADEEAPFALAYRIAFREVTERCLSPEVDVDATTGAVLRVHAGGAALGDRAGGSRFYLLKDGGDTKPIDITKHWHPFGDDTYTLETESSPKVITQNFHSRDEAKRQTYGTTFEQHAPGSWDSADLRGPGSAVDAHYHVTQALRYFQEAHGRKSMDGSNGDVYVVVHDDIGTDGGNNAFRFTVETPSWVFFHITNDQIVVGDGDLWQSPPAPGDPEKQNLMPFSAAFDIMAHEVAHGVTAHTSNLKYEYESGALNETFSDVMGISADQWLSPGRYKDGTRALIGDRLSIPGDAPLRDMINPLSVKNARQQIHYDKHTTCAGQTPSGGSGGNDFCGVHYDSGIGNRAWSLMTLGGVHQTSNVRVTSPLGWEKSRVLWYETFTRLHEQATFEQAAVAQLAWALRYDPSIVNTVGCAWYAVGAIKLDARVSPAAASLFCPTDPSAAGASAPPARPAPPPPPPPSTSGACAGHPNGWMCDPAAPPSAYACNGGAAAGTALCADPAQRCKPRSPTDPTATVDSSGSLECE